MFGCRALPIVLLLFAAVGGAQPDNNLVYQIFVRSFADTAGDTVAAGTPGEIGDLKGIKENLRYLNDGTPGAGDDLEAGILWLMPVFPSKSYHGYDTTDYRNINPEYGTLQDMDALIRAAHDVGMRIILDISFNHTSNEHDWFKQAVNDVSSPFRKFYHFAPDDGTPLRRWWHMATASNGSKIRYLGLFGPTMPDLNMAEPGVRREVKAIARFWLGRGIDGFRLDAAEHIFGDTFGRVPEPDILRNNDWWREFSDFAYSVNPKAVLVGEVWGIKKHCASTPMVSTLSSMRPSCILPGRKSLFRDGVLQGSGSISSTLAAM
jgi:glycosidase